LSPAVNLAVELTSALGLEAVCDCGRCKIPVQDRNRTLEQPDPFCSSSSEEGGSEAGFSAFRLNGRHLPFPLAWVYVLAHVGHNVLDEKAREAERELDAATRLADLNEAAKKLMRAKEALKRLDQQAPTRRGSGAAAPGAPGPAQRASGGHRPARAPSSAVGPDRGCG
jgi:hypothetical protein